MKRLFKWIAAVTGLLLIVVLALPLLIDANRFRPLLEQRLTAALARRVTIGNLSLSLFSGGVTASDLAIAEDAAFGAQPFLTAKSLKITVDMRALVLSRELHVQGITVDAPDVALLQTAEGVWNFSSLGAATSSESPATAPAPSAPADSAQLNLSIADLRIQNAHMLLASPADAPKHEFVNVNFELRNVSTTAVMPFTLEATSKAGGKDAGTLKLDGSAGPLALANAEQTPFDARIDLNNFDLATAASPASGLAGLLTFKGTVNSSGSTAGIKGALTIDNLKLSKAGAAATRPVGVNIALVHNLKTRHGEVARSTVKLGSASATISGSYNLAPTPPTFDAKLKGPNMALTELTAFLPMVDVVLPAGATITSGTATVDATAKGSLVALETAGSLKIEKANLSNYDLGSKLRAIAGFAGLPTGSTTAIDLVAANFQAAPAGTMVKDIQFVAPALGTLTGEGTVSPDHVLNFRMRAAVHASGMLATAVQQHGDTTTVPFTIQGTSSNPSFRPDVKAVANEKLQQAIKNPEGAIKTAKGIMDLFKKAPKQETK